MGATGFAEGAVWEKAAEMTKKDARDKAKKQREGERIGAQYSIDCSNSYDGYHRAAGARRSAFKKAVTRVELGKKSVGT